MSNYGIYNISRGANLDLTGPFSSDASDNIFDRTSVITAAAPANSFVAAGGSLTLAATDAIAIGGLVSADSGVAVGHGSSAGATSVAMGHNATAATAANDVAIGNGAATAAGAQLAVPAWALGTETGSPGDVGATHSLPVRIGTTIYHILLSSSPCA